MARGAAGVDARGARAVAAQAGDARLDHLVAHGIVERRPYGPSGSRHEYALTEPGRDLYPVILALLAKGVL